MDRRPHGIPMPPTGGGGGLIPQNSLLAGHSSVLCLFLCLAVTCKWALIRMATQVGFGSIRSTLCKGRGCVMSGAGGTAPFFVPTLQTPGTM